MIDKRTDRYITVVWKLTRTAAGRFSARAVAVMRGVEASRRAIDWLAERYRYREAARKAKAALEASRTLLVALVIGMLVYVTGCARWDRMIISADDNLPGLGVATPGPNVRAPSASN